VRRRLLIPLGLIVLLPIAVVAAPRDLKEIWDPPPHPTLPQRVPVLTGLDAPTASPAADKRNVILITVDTWRPDRLGLYGSPRPTSPWLEKMAEEAVVFERAIAPSSWTWPTMVSLISGVHPRAHGAIKPGCALCEKADTLAEVFHDAGYRTGFAGSNQYFEVQDSGFRQGFEFYFAAGDAPASRVLEYMGYFLEGAAEETFFLHLHLFDPHCPYDPSEDTLARMREVPMPVPESDERTEITWKSVGHACHAVPPMPRDQDIEQEDHPLSSDPAEFLDHYDGELAETDYALRLVRAMLAASELWDDSWVVITGDHGEEFGEHGHVGHGKNVFASTTWVPLIIRPPGGTEGRRVSTPVSLVDIAPTLAAGEGLDVPLSWQGRDLGPALRGEDLPNLPVLAETRYLDDWTMGLIVDDDRRFTVGGLLPIARMYDAAEPLDGANLLAQDDPEVRMQAAILAARLRSELRMQGEGAICEGATQVLDPSDWQQLKSLGYTSDVDPANRIRPMDREPGESVPCATGDH